MEDYAKKALETLGGLLGLNTGMAGQAAEVIKSRPYQLYVQEQQALGQPALSPEEWLKMQQSQQQRGGLLGQ